MMFGFSTTSMSELRGSYDARAHYNFSKKVKQMSGIDIIGDPFVEGILAYNELMKELII